MPFNLPIGVHAPCLTDMRDAYTCENDENGFIIDLTLSAEKLSGFLSACIALLDEPAFLFLEVPSPEEDEKKLRHSAADPYHLDVHYLDNCTHQRLQTVLKRYEKLLTNDGLMQFGFGGHLSGDEIDVDKCKTIHFFVQDAAPFVKLFEQWEIPAVQKLHTLWEYFNEETPGELSSYADRDKTIYDMADELKKEGLYHAQVREDD